ncbi:MAG TPA: ribosome silencing factor [Solirubrobacteraceae bacterium]|nr:ribosome silencing factor [Solirubrobacteraceae bacterium]
MSAGGAPTRAPLPAERLVGAIAGYAEDKKAIDLVELDLRGVLGYTDYFIVCSGNTGRQAKAIHDGILEGLKHEHDTLPRRVEGSADTGWILMDYLDVVVHIFTPEMREFYRLEQLWGEAPARVAGEASKQSSLPAHPAALARAGIGGRVAKMDG